METTPKSTGIVAKIVNFLKLGDEGKIGSFFDRLRKNLTKKIEAHERNKSTAKWNYDNKLSGLHDNLTDAKEQLEEAYLNIDVEKIKNNANQEVYEKQYWDIVEAAEAHVERINKEITKEKESFEKAALEYDKQIAELKFRLDRIA
jgi:hypothetical protein